MEGGEQRALTSKRPLCQCSRSVAKGVYTLHVYLILTSGQFWQRPSLSQARRATGADAQLQSQRPLQSSRN
eukprot:scaffold43505_cov13-Tisochrysis_lutea.AAC.2